MFPLIALHTLRTLQTLYTLPCIGPVCITLHYPESPGTLKGRATYRVVLKGIMEMSRVSTAEEVVEMPGVLRPRAIIYI